MGHFYLALGSTKTAATIRFPRLHFHILPPIPLRFAKCSSSLLTLEAVGVEEVLALLVALDAALGAADALRSGVQRCRIVGGVEPRGRKSVSKLKKQLLLLPPLRRHH